MINLDKLDCLPLPFLSALVKYFLARLEPTIVELLMGLHSNGRLLPLPANIRLGWKSMANSNTLAYYDRATITDVKSFIVQPPGPNVKKFTTVIYKCLQKARVLVSDRLFRPSLIFVGKASSLP